MIHIIEFNGIIDELVAFGEQKVMEDKVNRVISKCVKSGRGNLAYKVAAKYHEYIFKSDRVIASQISLMALKQIKPNV